MANLLPRPTIIIHLCVTTVATVSASRAPQNARSLRSHMNQHHTELKVGVEEATTIDQTYELRQQMVKKSETTSLHHGIQFRDKRMQKSKEDFKAIFKE
jgi:ABC-type transport system involved in cytochrome bd biosynthesis fused ATPase/permease subunit